MIEVTPPFRSRRGDQKEAAARAGAEKQQVVEVVETVEAHEAEEEIMIAAMSVQILEAA
jgi:hypothetical protein